MSSDKVLRVPNPGTPEAQMIGCECPVIDNHYGDGVPDGQGGKMFWYNGNCKLHAQKGNAQADGHNKPTDESPAN